MKRILAILLLFVSIQVNAQPWIYGNAGLKFINPNAKYYITNSAGDTVVNISDKGNMGIGKNTSPTPDSSAWAPGMGMTIGGTPGYQYPYLRFKYYDGATGYNDATLGMDGTSFLFWAGSTALTNWQWWINGTRIFSVQANTVVSYKTLLANAALQAPNLPNYSSGSYNLIVSNSTNSSAFEKFSISQLRTALGAVDSVTVSNDSLYEWKSGVKKFRYLHTAGAGGGVTSVGLSVPSWLSAGGTNPVTSSGTIAVTAATGQTANQFLATPNGSTGAVGLRSIVAADVPKVDSAKFSDTAKYATTAGNAINLNGHADTYFTPANGAITGATKTKITYDNKGLVTAGADATTADIAASTNKNYVTDAQLVVIGNTSGTNTGDQTITLTGDVTGSGNGSFAATIANGAVSLAKMANMASGNIIGRNTAGTGAPEVLSMATLKTMLSLTKSDVGLGNVDNTSDATKNSATATLTNKTLTAPVIATIVNTGTMNVPTVSGTLVQYAEGNTASASTITPAGDARENYYDVTALATAPTFAAPSGTPANHNSLLIRIKDNGTARALTWNAIYRAGTDFALPTTTVVGKTMYVQYVYNSADSKWDCIGLTQGF